LAPVQRTCRHGPARLHQSPARIARARAAATDAARHGTRRRAQRLRIRAPVATCVAPVLRDAAARGARRGALITKQPHPDRTSMTDKRDARMIDLSHTIEDGMITYKGLPAPLIC